MTNNIIHFVYPVWPNVRKLSYLNYIAVLLARQIQKPDHIYFWVNKEPDNGGWWSEIRPLVTVMQIDMPDTYYGVKIHYPQIRSDITRLEILNTHGGIYMDTDILLRRPLHDFMEGAFTMCYEPSDGEPQSACNALMIAKPHSMFIYKWLAKMHQAIQSQTWAYGGVVLPFDLHKEFPQLAKMYTADTFCPLDLSQNWLFSADPRVIEKAKEKTRNSYAIHAFETFWRDEIANITPEYCKNITCLFSEIANEAISMGKDQLDH